MTEREANLRTSLRAVFQSLNERPPSPEEAAKLDFMAERVADLPPPENDHGALLASFACLLVLAHATWREEEKEL